jgi:hypothetical protein
MITENPKMKDTNEKTREQIIFAMLEEFPTLKERVRTFLREDAKKHCSASRAALE